MSRSLHPFPARMASDVAINKLVNLPESTIVLDPMVGSGTVLRQATDLGLQALGFDTDPLAVLMSRVLTTPIDAEAFATIRQELQDRLADIHQSQPVLPWIDGDLETSAFIDYWFAPEQQHPLRRIACAIYQMEIQPRTSLERQSIDILKLALSRIIITKDKGASLARDVSHSRPHRVAMQNDYDVEKMFTKSISVISKRLTSAPPRSGSTVLHGDARQLVELGDESVDIVLTSPPYLNAIDYMRGHKFALVWLDHRIGDLRTIRANNVGTERGLRKTALEPALELTFRALGDLTDLPTRHKAMALQYSRDLNLILSEIGRTLRTGGQAILVIGNSCLRGVFVRNSAAVTTAASHVGLQLVNELERDLPDKSRYLPMSSRTLTKRMRTEIVLTFAKDGKFIPCESFE